jgi:tetratricopeptide (TPR) repeat protein
VKTCKELALLAIFSSIVICLASSVQAATKAPTAKEVFGKGLRLFKAEEYELALPHFEKAVALSKRRPSTVLALAQCQRILKMYAPALKHFQEYLDGKPNPKKVDQIRETIEVLKELSARAAEEAKKEKATEEAKKADSERIANAARRAEKAAKIAENAALQAKLVPIKEAPVIVETPIWSRPVFWVITGVAATGAAVTLGLIFSAEDEHYGGSTGVVANPLIRW